MYIMYFRFQKNNRNGIEQVLSRRTFNPET